MDDKILLIGAGYMAREYAKVLNNLNVEYDVIGRGKTSAYEFEQEIRKTVCCMEDIVMLEKCYLKSFNKAIVAVNVENLATVTKYLVQNGIKKILLEKPGGMNLEEIEEVSSLAERKNAQVYIAYNRRFYSSVIKAKEIINRDEGVSSFHFEFTEWAQILEKSAKPISVLQQVLINNSSHVIDLAFYLGGLPEKISSYRIGSLPWHTEGSKFVGAGISEKNVPFTYMANWEAPGRWGVEIMTQHHRLYLRPLEKLQIQNKNSVEINYVDIDDNLDIKFKPGVYRQVKSFLQDDIGELLPIQKQCKLVELYQKIRSGENH